MRRKIVVRTNNYCEDKRVVEENPHMALLEETNAGQDTIKWNYS